MAHFETETVAAAAAAVAFAEADEKKKSLQDITKLLIYGVFHKSIAPSKELCL